MGVSVRTKTRSRNMSLLMSSLLLTLASSAEIFHRIPQSRIPNSCSTLSGSTCVFPFSYAGVTHYQCTYTDSRVPWCATATNTDGSVITNSWGDCSMSSSSSCTSESLTITPCTTTTGATCQFPFRYAGVVYTECATVDQSGPWCSTSITAAGEHIPGSEGFCPSTCPVTGGTSGGSTSTPCTPGTSFTVDCNTCVCNSLGEAVCTTDTCSGSTTTTTSTTSTTTTTSTTCVVSSGPASGQTCVFPFTFNGVTHSSCADWIYGGQPAGTTWCSTQVDSAGVHVNGQGFYGFCPTSCPGVQPQSINLLTKSKNSAVRFGGGRGPQ